MNLLTSISEKNLSITALLSTVLADEMILFIKIKKSYWNSAGENHTQLHDLFEAHSHQIEDLMDETSCRITKRGSRTIGTIGEFSKLSTIKEVSGKYFPPMDLKKELLKDHETIITQLRKNIDDCCEKFQDLGTADFLIGLMEKHEKMIVQLNSCMMNVVSNTREIWTIGSSIVA
jgi:starvation-inducible DNA-binding protein